jgi:protein-ribulosamine 3-kinase
MNETAGIPAKNLSSAFHIFSRNQYRSMRIPPSLLPVFNACRLSVEECMPVAGGDINLAYGVKTVDSKFFLKVNDSGRFPEMFSKEAQGLTELKQSGCLKTPDVVQNGICAGQQYLLLEWLERGRPDKHSWQSFGAGLACLHRKTNNEFGWAQGNYIGSLKQCNDWRKSWVEFYRELRVMPLVMQLVERGDFSLKDQQVAEQWCLSIDAIFPDEPPAMLHGDLWSGNFMISDSGRATIFDPAVYFGHREMDIGMSKLFGGFDAAFYEAYDSEYPLEKDWQLRLPYTQMYPLLVHAVLFGGSYVQQCKG